MTLAYGTWEYIIGELINLINKMIIHILGQLLQF